MHKDEKKTVPLYITTAKKDIRKIWKHYAKGLRKSAIISNEYGTSSRDYHDLDTPLRELIKNKKLPAPQIGKEPTPKLLAIVKRGSHLVIKIKELLFDAYNLIAVLLLACFSGFIVFAAYHHNLMKEYFSADNLLVFYAVALLFVLYGFLLLIQRDKLVIKPEKIVLLHKFILFSVKSGEIYKDKIEEVALILNPATGRSYIALISGEQSLIFGKKLPLYDLRWLQQYIVMELIK